jgi:serine/threonine-protein kinase
LERYEIVRFMANGGFGDVYEARDTRLDRRVVVKSLRAKAAEDPDIRARFLREGRLAAAIEHPHVVRVFDVIEHEHGDAYLVMEYLDGRDLGEELTARGPLPVEWLCDVMLPVCAAVAQVHDREILHRDLKPGNLFLSRSLDGEIIPKLLDFGISRPLGDRAEHERTRTGVVLGSPRYMSPEQLEGKRSLDGRVDVYALGAVLYRCLTGALPYQHPGDDSSIEPFTVFKRMAARELVAPRAWRPDLPAALEAVVLRAMAFERDGRFGDARELGAALLPFASLAVRARWEAVLGRHERTSRDVTPARFDATFTVPLPTPPVAPAPDTTTTSASATAFPALTASRAPERRRSLTPWLMAGLVLILCATCAGVAVRMSRTSNASGPATSPPPNHGAAIIPPVERAPVVAPASAPPPATPPPIVASTTVAPAVAPVAEPAQTGGRSPRERRLRHHGDIGATVAHPDPRPTETVPHDAGRGANEAILGM